GWWSWGKVNFSVRGQAGVEYATGSGGIPITKEFTLGGTDLRGYITREFRGDTTASAQNEAIVPITHFWQLKVRADFFYDVGLFYRREAGSGQNDFPRGVGGGLRFYLKQLAIPVMGVDVGYGVEDREIGYYFTFGLRKS